MRVRFLVVLLVLLPAIPLGISLFHFINNGGLGWPMIWSNEVNFWSVVFSILTILGVRTAYRNRNAHPRLLVVSLLLAAILLTPGAYNIAKTGFGASSKSDDNVLHPIDFLTSEWWI